MASIIEKIKEKMPLEQYVETLTGLTWRSVGRWKDLSECCFCGGKDCARLSPDGNFYCFQCYTSANNSIVFRSHFEKIGYKVAVEKFCEELRIKQYDKSEVEWVLMREVACEKMREILFTCPTKYEFGGQSMRPLDYLTGVRKHSIEALLNFRIGFNDGSLDPFLKSVYKEEVVAGSGLSIIPAGCFTYPYIVGGEVKYFRIKDPNKVKKIQMPLATRSKNAVWFNQDALKNGGEIWTCEGEDDAVSLWDCGMDAVAACGTVTHSQVNFLKTYNLGCIYSCFDRDATGNRDTELLVKNIDNPNVFIIEIPPEKKDIDQLIRDTENKEELIHTLKGSAKTPTAEMRSSVRQKENGYYIMKQKSECQLTNWTLTIEAVIYSAMTEDVIRKAKIKSGDYEKEVFLPSEALANVNALRRFLYSKCDKILLFQGTDNDLSTLMEYWGVAFSPKIIYETDHIGEISQGFIGGNVFVSNANEYKPLVNGYLSLDDRTGIQIIEIVRKGGGGAGLPIFPLTEPEGGIATFKEHIFDLLVKNRNLKVAMALGWLKATLWSGRFYREHRFFPIFNLHGKFQGGKSIMAYWMMSMMGLRDCPAKRLSDKSTSEVSLSRQFAYYSSLPVLVDDYRANEWSERFHDFFRGIFDRTSSTKGIKEDFGIRQVPLRGCLLLTGENIPPDPALQSRMVSVEVTKDERKEKYFKDLVKLEPQFASIGLDWVRNRANNYDFFDNAYREIEPIIRKELGKPREASVLSVAVAGALTEPYFMARKDDVLDYALKIQKEELQERKKDEIIGNFWEAVDIINKKQKINDQLLHYDWAEKEVYLHIPGLLGEIKGNQTTRHYDLPGHREFVKLLKQEPYVKGARTVRVEGKPSNRWVIDILTAPEIVKNMFLDEPEPDSNWTEEKENDPF